MLLSWQIKAHKSIKGHCASLAVHIKNCDQHQQRPSHRVDEKFYCSIDASLSTPDTDNEIHWNQHCFPEHIEKQHITGKESTNHCALQKQQERHTLRDSLLDCTPGTEYYKWPQKSSQHYQEQRNTIKPQTVIDLPICKPWYKLDELVNSGCIVKVKPQMQRQNEIGNCNTKCYHTSNIVFAGKQKYQQRPSERQKCYP